MADTVTGNTLLKERLEWFQDLKFGFMVHWGPYSQKGCFESWPLSAEDTWARPGYENIDIVRFRKEYWDLNRTFNPMGFDPCEWADLALQAGMKYFVFTTKHHDGFNMYDTKLSDYKITGKDCPFHTHLHADIAKALFDAFRARDFGIGAYYSKADWHSPYYWSTDHPAANRNPNYDTLMYPEIWQKFVEFVHGQIYELVSEYGPIDILWLDAGQVKPPLQDIRIGEIAGKARRFQPGLIVVDREGVEEYIDYATPEQFIPPQPLDKTWESCVTMGDQWSYKPNDRYKSARELIHLLVDTVAKGGNLLLNVGPMSDGRIPPQAVNRMQEIGMWLKVNGEAIYGTRVCLPYRSGKWAFTQRQGTVYAIYMMDENEVYLPETIRIPLVGAKYYSKIVLLGVEATLEMRQEGEEGLFVEITGACTMAPPSGYACVFGISP